MEREYVIFGDYKCHLGPRADFKVFDFVVAETPELAFQCWKTSVLDSNQGAEGTFADEVYVMQVEGTRWVFDLATGDRSHRYRRTDLPGPMQPDQHVPEPQQP